MKVKRTIPNRNNTNKTMTKEQLDHLRLLKAHLEGLLAKAAKRTPGEWTTLSKTEHIDYGEPIRVVSDQPPFSVAYHGSENCFLSAGDAAFIASCAGNAEAGWRSTLKAIDLCIANLHTDPEFPTHERGEICDNDGRGCRACEYTERMLLGPLLAEWPIESLKNN